MKRNDFIFLSISLIYSITFISVFLYQLIPEKKYMEQASISGEGTLLKPTGTTTDIEKIKGMIQEKKLSEKEALYYKKLYNEEEEKTEKQIEQKQIRRRWRRGRQQANE